MERNLKTKLALFSVYYMSTLFLVLSRINTLNQKPSAVGTIIPILHVRKMSQER